MRRLSFAAIAALFALGACTDSTAPDARVDVPAVQEAPTIETYDATAVAQCPVISEAELRALVAQALRGRALNGRVGLGMFDAASQVRRRNIRAARILVWGLAEFIYKRRSEALPPETMARLINGLLCWVGLPPRIPQNSDSFFILPSDTAQVILRQDRQAGVLLPPNPVGEPSILTINYADTIRLNTKYDQYPGGVNITLSSPLVGGTALVAVCPSPALTDTTVLNRLRLGHQASFGFEILPPADPTPVGLDCSVPTASVPTSLVGRMVASLSQAILPKALHAKTRVFELGGGVGGSASEFSPFAPIDPALSFGGGVGGSASEFLRAAIAADADCPVMTGAIGSPLRQGCRPQVTVRTASGTPFIGVPVQFNVLSGGGSVGIEGAAASCGSLGGTASSTTNADGVIRTCWTLGLTPGVNALSAVPSLGGDALPGTIFLPPTLTFTAIGNPAAQFGLGSMPGSITAGVPFDVSIEVQDHVGNVVEPATGSVVFALELGEASASMQMQSRSSRGVAVTNIGPAAFEGFQTVNIVNGVATLDDYVITRAIGRPYRFVVSGAGLPTFTTPWITISPAAPATVAPLWFPTSASTATPIPIGAKAFDAFQNSVPNTTLVFTALTAGSSINGGTTATGVTGPNGFVELSGWQLAPGTNSLRISVQSNPSISITVTATGVAP